MSMMPPPDWLDNADEQAGLASFLSQSGYPLGPINPPSPIPPPGLRIGPVRLSGNGLDSASLAILTALHNGPQPRGFGQALAAGLAGGYSQARYNRALERGQANEQARQGAADLSKERAKVAASYLATHRHEQQRAANQLALKAANPATSETPEEKRKRLFEEAKARAAGTAAGHPDDDEGIDYSGLAEAIDTGNLPPTIAVGRSTKYNYKLLDALKKRKTNLSTKMADFNATQAFIRSANGTTQVRFRQALKAIPGLIGEVKDLNQQLAASGIKESRMPLVNRAQLAGIRGGFMDSPQAQNLVTRYTTAVNAIPSEVGFAEMGGTSPTDKAMDRAVKQFKEATGFEAANAALDEILRLASIRENTMNLAGAISPANPTGAGGYFYGQQGPPPQVQATAPTPALPSSDAGKAFLASPPKRKKK